MKKVLIFGIFIFMTKWNFMLNWIEHEKSFITSGPGCTHRSYCRFCCALAQMGTKLKGCEWFTGVYTSKTSTKNKIPTQSCVRWENWLIAYFRNKRKGNRPMIPAHYKVVIKAVYTQQSHNVTTTSLQRRCNVMTLQRRCYDVIVTLCVCWVFFSRPAKFH